MILEIDKSRPNEKMINNLKVWENHFPSKTIFVNKGKKSRHSLQLIAVLALNGPSTTRDMAKFVIKSSPKYTHSKLNNREISKVEQTFARLIEGRLEKITGRRKSRKFYPGLRKFDYVKIIEKGKNSKNNDAIKYSLSFRGFLFALGFNFKGKDLEKFLCNVRKNHLFFAYVENIAKDTTYNFARKIFLDPIYEIIKNEIMQIDKDPVFYFSIFAENIGRSLNNLSKDIIQNYNKKKGRELEQNAEIIKKWTYYDDRPTHDWHHSMLDVFYPNVKDWEFFDNHASVGMEVNLLYKIMQKVHLVYFGTGGGFIPRTTQKIPYSTRWKEHQKYNSEYKNPRDHDKKRKIMIRYDADEFLL